MIRVSGIPYEVEEKDLWTSISINETGSDSLKNLRSTALTKDQAIEMALDALNEWMSTSSKTDFSPAIMKTLEAMAAIDSVMEK